MGIFYQNIYSNSTTNKFKNYKKLFSINSIENFNFIYDYDNILNLNGYYYIILSIDKNNKQEFIGIVANDYSSKEIIIYK